MTSELLEDEAGDRRPAHPATSPEAAPPAAAPALATAPSTLLAAPAVDGPPPAPAFEPLQPGHDAAAIARGAPPPAPVAWNRPASVAPVEPVERPGAGPWGLTDPGPILDGTWRSPGYGSSAARATALRIVLAASIASDLLAIAVQFGVPRLVAMVQSDQLTAAEANAILGAMGVVGLVSLAVGLGIFVVAPAWIGRMVDNIPPLTGRTPERSPQLAMWSWVIPIVSWVLPYLVIRDALWRLRTSDSDTTPRWLGAWWIARVCAGLATMATLGRGDPAGLQPNLLIVAALALTIVGTVGDIAVVTILTRRENAQASHAGLLGASGRQWPVFLDEWLAAAAEDAGDDTVDDVDDDDPLARHTGEPEEDYQIRLLATLEGESVTR